MDGAVIVWRCADRCGRDARLERADGDRLERRLRLRVEHGEIQREIRVGGLGRFHQTSLAALDARQRGVALGLPTRRNASMLVHVVGVAGAAARLLDRVLDHGHHDVIRDPSLAWTVIVQNVTESNPALLHRNSLEPCFRW
jgi:hypothetical protein